jgi:hypothetical protein
MSRLTQKGATAPLNLFTQAYGGATTGTGFFDPSMATYVGQRFDASDGREFVLVSNGVTALVSGNLIQSPAIVAGHQTLAMTVPTATPATAGLFQILVTNGATVINQGFYNGGYAIVKDGTGIGQTLKIASHLGAAASGTCLITLEDAIQVTLDATSVINLIQNPYQNVIVAPTTATGNVAGVTVSPVAASVAPTWNGTTGLQTATGTQQYAIICTKGIVSCLSDANVATVGLGVMRSTTTAGSVAVMTATGFPLGNALQTTISAKAGAIFIDL